MYNMLLERFTDLQWILPLFDKMLDKLEKSVNLMPSMLRDQMDFYLKIRDFYVSLLHMCDMSVTGFSCCYSHFIVYIFLNFSVQRLPKNALKYSR